MKGYRFIVGYVLAVMVVVLCLTLCGCKTKYVAVPEYHTEYITRTDTFIQRDSVYKYDSVFVKVQGDTVTVEHWATMYRDRWREKVVRDTVIKNDSIRVLYPVERQLSKWEQLKVNIGGFVLILLALLLLLYLIRVWRDKRRARDSC